MVKGARISDIGDNVPVTCLIRYINISMQKQHDILLVLENAKLTVPEAGNSMNGQVIPTECRAPKKQSMTMKTNKRTAKVKWADCRNNGIKYQFEIWTVNETSGKDLKL